MQSYISHPHGISSNLFFGQYHALLICYENYRNLWTICYFFNFTIQVLPLKLFLVDSSLLPKSLSLLFPNASTEGYIFLCICIFDIYFCTTLR